jgi:hypothetical protein
MLIGKNKGKILKIKLSKLQNRYLPAIRWLINYDMYNASGRTFLLAVVFLERAFHRFNEWVYVMDHYHSYQSLRHSIIPTIENLAKDLNLKIEISVIESKFRLIP